MKILRNKKRFHQQGAVEVEVLKCVKAADKDKNAHVIHMHEAFIFRSHICMTFDLLSINLYDLLKANKFQGMSIGLIRAFAIQILKAMRLMKKLDIIHCDMKPENILLNRINKSRITIIDFGSACYTDQRVYTYIQSRFYRAPEIMLGIPYTTAIDMWSVGCMLVELMTGYPLFPGESEKE